MAHVYREIRRTNSPSVDTVGSVSYFLTLLARLVTTIGGIIVAVLSIRFILSLLGANRTNDFANLIYNLSHPFVAPFFGLFNYREQFGIVRFEYETLIAIIFWAVITGLIARLLTINRNSDYVA